MAEAEKQQQQQDPSKRVQFPLDSESYKIVAEIGNGASAVVYKAICVPMNSTIVAIKDIDLDRARTDLENIRREAKLMSLLSHPNILNAHCSFIVNRRLWVVMPFMSAGSLLSIITSRFPEGFSEPCIASVLKETLSAVSYLHDQGHLHRDIKAGNILIDSNGSVKLADFGVSASVYESRSILGGSSSSSSASGGSSSFMLTDVAGTPYWMAPEMIHSNTGYNFKADIWSFGITALELAYGRAPLSHLPPSKSLLLKITKRFRFSDCESLTKDKNKKFSKNFKDLVGSCLQQDPSKRPTAERLLKHPFFKNCRSGSDILLKNVLQGLPSIEDRFKEIKAQQGPLVNKKVNEDEDDDDPEWYVKQRRISGWNFNEEGCELHPVFPIELIDDFVVKKVRFGGETIIPQRHTSEVGVSSIEASGTGSGSITTELNWSSSSTEEEETQVDEVRQVGLTEVERNVDIGVGPLVGGQVMDKEVMVSGLLALKRILDDQQEKVGSLIRVLQGEQGGEDYMRREEQMPQAMERLRAELESERRKNSELEMEVEFLKLQISGEQSSDAGAGSAATTD